MCALLFFTHSYTFVHHHHHHRHRMEFIRLLFGRIEKKMCMTVCLGLNYNICNHDIFNDWLRY